MKFYEWMHSGEDDLESSHIDDQRGRKFFRTSPIGVTIEDNPCHPLL